MGKFELHLEVAPRWRSALLLRVMQLYALAGIQLLAVNFVAAASAPTRVIDISNSKDPICAKDATISKAYILKEESHRADVARVAKSGARRLTVSLTETERRYRLTLDNGKHVILVGKNCEASSIPRFAGFSPSLGEFMFVRYGYEIYDVIAVSAKNARVQVVTQGGMVKPEVFVSPFAPVVVIFGGQAGAPEKEVWRKRSDENLELEQKVIYRESFQLRRGRWNSAVSYSLETQSYNNDGTSNPWEWGTFCYASPSKSKSGPWSAFNCPLPTRKSQ